ncbi:MAG: hypothetical protein ABI867_13515 [Kofleriaceae bacterium]
MAGSKPVDPAAFAAAMPAGVRATPWWNARTNSSQITLAESSVQDPGLAADVAGWIAGMTMFVDLHRRVANLLLATFRLDVVPHALAAFAAGIAATLLPPRKLWATIEQLAVRSPSIPAGFEVCLPVACSDPYPQTHEAGMHLARLLGDPARALLLVARAAEQDPARRKALGAVLAGIARDADAVASSPTRALELLLTRLRDAWRTTRDPALATELAVLGDELAYQRGPILDRSPDAKSWPAIAHAGDPSDLDRLLDAPWPQHPALADLWLGAIAKYAPDPRFAKLARLAAVFAWSDGAHEVCAALLAGSASPPAELPARYHAAKLAAEAVVATPADPALLAEARAVTGPIAERDRLLAEHAADPADLGLRGVLADVLVEAGDPRGELITLQLAIAGGSRNAKAASRVSELLALHADRFTGPLPGVDARTRVFERGFLVALTTAPVTEPLRACVHRREWTTLERLGLAATDFDPTELIRRMPLLHHLETTPACLDALARSGPWPKLRTILTDGSWLPATGAAFPSLTVLGGSFAVEGDPIAVAGQLGLEVLIWYTSYRTNRPAIRPYRSGPPMVRFASGTRGDSRWNFELERGSTHAYLDCPSTSLDTRWGSIDSVLSDLARAGIERLSIHFTDNCPRSTDELEEALRELRGAAQGMELDLEGRHIDV